MLCISQICLLILYNEHHINDIHYTLIIFEVYVNLVLLKYFFLRFCQFTWDLLSVLILSIA